MADTNNNSPSNEFDQPGLFFFEGLAVQIVVGTQPPAPSQTLDDGSFPVVNP